MSDPSTLQLADRCVMCGLCSQHCPTYRLSHSESESPRGRISLIQGLLKGQLQADRTLLGHLNSCLQCRACERSCPSGVPYGQVMDAMRQQLAQQGKRPLPWNVRLLMRIFASAPSALRHWQRGLYLYRKYHLAWPLQVLAYFGSSGLKRLHRLLPPHLERPQRALGLYPADTSVEMRGKVHLFTGCASRLFDQEAQRAAIFLLNRLGYVVSMPAEQVCCGALHQHEGREEQAQQLAGQNIQAYADAADGPILSMASGCSSHLRSYPQLLHGQSNRFASRVEDISTFLARAEWPQRYRFEPLAGKVLVHEPCLQRNVLRQSYSSYELLKRLPGLELEPLQGNEVCCGAAGGYMLGQPQQADALLAPKLEAARQQRAQLLVTTNIGCALHIQAGLRARGELIEVIHPLTLLARQLRDA